MSRKISGLVWARACNKPACIPTSRPRGRKAAGLRYERELAKAVPRGVHGQWFEFADSAGHGWCQPDLFLVEEEAIYVLESKYTWKRTANGQIANLYKPVLEMVFGKPVRGIVVCKVLTSETPRGSICRTLDEAKARAAGPLPVVLHWIGAGLEPFTRRTPGAHLASSPGIL